MSPTHLVLICCLGCGIVSGWNEKDTEFIPDEISVDIESAEMKTSAKISYTANAPEGTNIVHVKAEEIDDLTGNVFEEGYEFGYSEVVPYIYYPELKEGKYSVFTLRFGKRVVDSPDEWTQWSKVSVYHRSDKSGYLLIRLTRDWVDARDWCFAHDMRLAAITKAHQISEIEKLMSNHNAGQEKEDQINEAWIGLWDANYNNTETTLRKWTWVGKGYNHHSTLDSKLLDNFEYDGRDLDHVESPDCRGCDRFVKINKHGNFVVATNQITDKGEFVCETGKVEHVKQRDITAHEGGGEEMPE